MTLSMNRESMNHPGVTTLLRCIRGDTIHGAMTLRNTVTPHIPLARRSRYDGVTRSSYVVQQSHTTSTYLYQRVQHGVEGT